MVMSIAVLVILLAAPLVCAKQHIVGGSTGWSTAGDYKTWSAGETFTVGDTLVFNYDSSHKVNVVSKSDYDNCATGNPLNSYSNGSTTIPLAIPGPLYFICPSFGHCGGGMKLAVNVLASSTTPPGAPPTTSPATPAPPSGSSGTPGTPAATYSPPPPPPPGSPSGAYGNLCNVNNLMLVGVSLVLAVVMGFAYG